MTELSFLLDLLLKHDLPQETKLAIADRIKKVEESLNERTIQPPLAPMRITRQPDQNPPPHMVPEVVPMPVQTQAAAEAMMVRQVALQGKVVHDPHTGRPRKF